jgi:hypothetical protein
MKKIFLTLGLVIGISSMASAFEFGANRGYDKQYIRYSLRGVAAGISTSTIIVDLSNTTNWPHKRTKELHIYDVRINVDKTAASTCTVKLGVVNYAGPSSGSVTWFFGVENERNVSNTYTSILRTSDLVYNLKVVQSGDADGSTPYILSNDTTSRSAIWLNNVKIPAVTGTLTIPEVGDLIMQVSNGAVVVDVYLEIAYSGEN